MANRRDEGTARRRLDAGLEEILGGVTPPDLRYRVLSATSADRQEATRRVERLQRAGRRRQRATSALPATAGIAVLLAAVYAAAGRPAEAEAEVSSVLKDNSTLTLAYMRATVPFQKEEDLERYLDLLRQAGLPE